MRPGTKYRLIWVTVLFYMGLAGLGRTWAANSDPKPPQLSIDFYYPPSPITQHGTPRLVYEMRLANYVPETYVLDSIDVQAGEKHLRFSGPTLRNMMRFFGERERAALTCRFEPDRSAIIYFMLAFHKTADIPAIIRHTLEITAADGTHHRLATEPLTVMLRQPVVVNAPLHGRNWLAGDSVHKTPDAAHRRTILLLGGKPWLAQRYAIDWVRYRMVNGTATTWSGPEHQNTSYFCYNEPIDSVADGTVVEATDGMAENIPHSGKYAEDINFVNAGGNHVIVDIGGGHYVFYAHMRPGSVTVKAGARVRMGQVLGRVGNSGSSTEPHLHIHIVDRPSFLGGNGVPYEFANFSASGSPVMLDRPHDQMFFRDFGALSAFHADYPANNAAVNFP